MKAQEPVNYYQALIAVSRAAQGDPHSASAAAGLRGFALIVYIYSGKVPNRMLYYTS